MIYFDHNATSPLHPAARQAWLEANEKFIGNPSSPHRIGGRADAVLTEARQKLAGFLGCDPLDIVWTSGATESNNMALHHFGQSLPAQSEVWISAIEHPCVLEAARAHFRLRHRLIPVTRSGVVNLDWLRTEIRQRRPGLIAVMAANNETGVLQPWREVLSLCREYELPFFTDATQWIGKLPADGLGECDFVSGSAHKFGGPKGVGFLKCPGKGRVEPFLRGGPQEEGRRAGTENVAGVLSMIAALEVREAALATGGEAGRGQRLEGRRAIAGASPFSPKSEAVETRLGWREAFVQKMLESLPGAEVVGTGLPRLWNTVSALMPQADCQQRWVVKLDKAGFAVSTGSACASGKEEASHVIAALGYAPAEAGRVLRFSSGWETTVGEWEALGEALVKVHQGMQCSQADEPEGARMPTSVRSGHWD